MKRPRRHQFRPARNHRRLRRRDETGGGARDQEDGVRVDHQPAAADRSGRQRRGAKRPPRRPPASASTASRSTASSRIRPSPTSSSTPSRQGQRAGVHSLRRRQSRRRDVDDQAARGRSLGHRRGVAGSDGARPHEPGAEAVRDRLRAVAQAIARRARLRNRPGQDPARLRASRSRETETKRAALHALGIGIPIVGIVDALQGIDRQAHLARAAFERST